MAQGVPGSLRPQIILTFRHYKGGRSSAKRIGRLYPERNPWYSLSEAESTSGHMVSKKVVWNPKEGDHLGYVGVGVDGRKMLKRMLKIGCGSVVVNQ